MDQEQPKTAPVAPAEPQVQPANPALGSIADTRTKVKVEVTQEEKTQFFKAFLSDKPYTQRTELFGGQFTVAFRTLSVQESNDIFKQVIFDQNNGVPKTDEAYFVTLVTYRVALALEQVNDQPWLPDVTASMVIDKDKAAGMTYVRARAKGFDGWPSYKLQALLEAYRIFEQKVIHLTEQVNDPSFWNPEK